MPQIAGLCLILASIVTAANAVTCPGANGCPSFTYPQNITLELGVAMTPVAPSSVQFASQFTVLNPLPSGLVINASTGVISGTPNATGILTAAIQGTTQYFPSYPFVHGGTFSAVVGFSIGPANNPVSVSFSDSDNRANRLSGSITVAVPATETDISSYELHWGSSPSVRLTSASSIATGLTPTGSNIVFSLPVGTTRPVGATHIIAYSRNGGFGLRPAAVTISDFVSPQNNPSSLSFTDTDPQIGSYGGSIVIGKAVSETDVYSYALYWATDANISVAPVVTDLAKTGGTVSFLLPAGTTLPALNVTRMLAFTVNPSGLGSFPAVVVLTDYRPAIPSLSTSAGPSGSTVASNVLIVSLTFNQNVTGVSANDVVVTYPGGSFTKSAVAGSGSSFSLTVTLTAPFTPGTVSLSFNASSSAVLPAAIAPLSSYAVTYSPPVASVTSSSGGNGSSTAARTVSFTVNFTSPVSGLSPSDFQVSTSGGVNVAKLLTTVVPGLSFQLDITVQSPMSAGTYSVSIPAGSGGVSPPFPALPPFTVVYDPPTVVLTSSAGVNGSTITTDSFTFTATFSKAVVGVTASDFNVSVVGSTVLNLFLSPASSTQYTLGVTVSTPIAAGVITAQLKDASGFIVPANVASLPFVVVYAPPSATLTSSAGVNGSSFAGNVVNVTVSFSSPVSGVSVNDFVVTSTGPPVSKALSGSGSTYTLTVTVGSPLAAGTIAVQLGERAGAIVPPNAASSRLVWTYAPPTVTLSSSIGGSGLTFANSTFNVTAIFSVPVSGLTAADFVVSGAPNDASKTLTGSGTTFVLTVSLLPPVSPSIVSVSLPEAAGSISPKNLASSLPFLVQYVPPFAVLTCDRGANASYTNNSLLSFVATFSGPVSGLTTADFNVTVPSSLAVSTSLAGSGSVYTLSVAVLTPGSVVGSIVVAMPGSQPGSASTVFPAIRSSAPFTITYDTTRPGLILPISTNAETLNVGQTLTLFANFNKSIAAASLALFEAPHTVVLSPVFTDGTAISARFSHVITASDPASSLMMVVTMTDLAGNRAVEFVNASDVLIDPIPPKLNGVSVIGPSRIGAGESVIIVANASEQLQTTTTLTVFTNSTPSDPPTVMNATYPTGASSPQPIVWFPFVIPATTPAGPLTYTLRLVDRAGNVNTTSSSLSGVLSLLSNVTFALEGGGTSQSGGAFVVVVGLSRSSTVGSSASRCALLTVSPAVSVIPSPTTVPSAFSGFAPTVFACVVTPSTVGDVTINVPTDAFVASGVFSDAKSALFPYAIPTNGSTSLTVVASSSSVSLGPINIPAYSGRPFLRFAWSLASSVCTTAAVSFANTSAEVTVLSGLGRGCVYVATALVTDSRFATPALASSYSLAVSVRISWPAVSSQATTTLSWCVPGQTCPLVFGAGGFDNATILLALVSADTFAPVVLSSPSGGGSAVIASVPSTTTAFNWIVPTSLPVGTYRIQSRLVSGDSFVSGVGPALLIAPKSYKLDLPSGLWGPCSATCGLGQRWRQMVCVFNNGTQTSDLSTYCLDVPLPSLVGLNSEMNEPCMAGACESAQFDWFIGAFGGCSASCGGGIMSRTIECRNVTNSVVDASRCVTAHKYTPNPTEACNQDPCDVYRIVGSAWSTCSTGCGMGAQYRTLSCVGAFTGTAVPFSSKCTADALYSAVPAAAVNATSVIVSQPCNSTACAGRVIEFGVPTRCLTLSGGTPSLASCGGSRLRTDACVDYSNGTGVVVPFSFCSTVRSDSVVLSCPTDTCSIPRWDVGPFGPCSGRVDGLCGGTRTRTVRCVDSVSFTRLDNSACLNFTKLPAPASEVVCSACVYPVTRCLGNCSGHGVCGLGLVCKCDSGYSGSACDVPDHECVGTVKYVHQYNSSYNATECCNGSLAFAPVGPGQQCCLRGRIDVNGACCEAGLTLDACGVCGGSAKFVDAGGRCCSGERDGQGMCCTIGVDACGVCGGYSDTCGVGVQLTLPVGSSVVSDCATLSDRLSSSAGALSSWFAGNVSVATGISQSRIIVRSLLCASSRRLAARELATSSVTVGVTILPDWRADASGSMLTASTLSALTSATSALTVGGVRRLAGASGPSQPVGICGNGICEAGEQCVSGSSTPCCAADCPNAAPADCPLSSSGAVCGGKGTCVPTLGGSVCLCYAGYAGAACSECVSPAIAVGGLCSAVAVLPPAVIISTRAGGPAIWWWWIILLVGLVLLLCCLLGWFLWRRNRARKHKILRLTTQDASVWPFVDPRTRAPELWKAKQGQPFITPASTPAAKHNESNSKTPPVTAGGIHIFGTDSKATPVMKTTSVASVVGSVGTRDSDVYPRRTGAGSKIKMFVSPSVPRTNQVVPFMVDEACGDSVAIPVQFGEEKDGMSVAHASKKSKVASSTPTSFKHLSIPSSVGSLAGSASTKRKHHDLNGDAIVNVLPRHMSAATDQSSQPPLPLLDRVLDPDHLQKTGVAVRLVSDRSGNGTGAKRSPRNAGVELRKQSGVFQMLKSALGSTLDQARQELEDDRVAALFDDPENQVRGSPKSEEHRPAAKSGKRSPRAASASVVRPRDGENSVGIAVLPRVNSRSTQQQLRRPYLPPVRPRDASPTSPSRRSGMGSARSNNGPESPELTRLRHALRVATARARRDAEIAANARDRADEATQDAKRVAKAAHTALEDAHASLSRQIEVIDDLSRESAFANATPSTPSSELKRISQRLEAAERDAETARVHLRRIHAFQAVEVAAVREAARGAVEAFIALELDRIAAEEQVCRLQAAVGEAEIQAAQALTDAEAGAANRRLDELNGKIALARDAKVVKAVTAAKHEVESALKDAVVRQQQHASALDAVHQTLESELARLQAEKDVAIARRDSLIAASEDDAELAYVNAEQAFGRQQVELEQHLIDAEAAAARTKARELLRARGVDLDLPGSPHRLDSATSGSSRRKSAWLASTTGGDADPKSNLEQVLREAEYTALREAEAVKAAKMTASEAHQRARQLAAEKEVALVRAEAEAVRLESTAIAAHREAASLADEMQVLASSGQLSRDPATAAVYKNELDAANARAEAARREAVAAREAVKAVRAQRDEELMSAISRAKAAAEAAVALELARIKAAESAARLRAQLAELDKDDAVISARLAASAAKRHLESVTAKLKREKSDAIARTLRASKAEAEARARATEAELQEKIKHAESRAVSMLEVELARLRAEKEAAVEEARQSAQRQEAELETVASRAIAAAQRETLRLRSEMETSLLRLQSTATQQQIDVLNQSHRVITSMRESANRQMAEKDDVIAAARAAVLAEAEAARLARAAAVNAQATVEQLAADNAVMLARAEAEAARREAEAEHVAVQAVRRAQEAAQASLMESAAKAAAAEARAAEEAIVAEEAKRAADLARQEVDRIRREKDDELARAVARAKYEAEIAVRLELERIKGLEEEARAKAREAETTAKHANDKARRQAAEAERRIETITQQLEKERDMTIYERLLEAKRDSEMMLAQLKDQAQRALADAEARARSQLQAELAKLAAEKDAALVRAQLEAARREAAAEEAAQRAVADMEKELARVLTAKDAEIARVEADAQKRSAEAAQSASLAIMRFESEVSAIRSQKDALIAAAEAKADQEAQQARDAKRLADSAQQAVERLTAEKAAAIRAAEAAAARREMEAEAALRAAKAELETANAIAAQKDAEKTAAADRRVAEEARRAENAKKAAEDARKEVERVRAEKEKELRDAVAKAKADADAVRTLELERIRTEEHAARLRAQKAEEAAAAANERAREEARRAEEYAAELAAKLRRERDVAVADALEKERRNAEIRALQLQEQAKVRLEAAEARAKSQLTAELERLAAEKDAAIAKAELQASMREAAAQEAARRALAEAEQEIASLKMAKEVEMARLEAEAQRRTAAAVAESQRVVSKLEQEASRIRQQKDELIAAAEAKAVKEASEAARARATAQAAQAEVERLSSDMSAALRKLEEDAERKRQEAEVALETSKRRTEEAVKAALSQGEEKARRAELRAAEEAQKAQAAVAASEAARQDVERVRLEKDNQLRAAVAKAREDAEAAMRIELERIKSAEEAARLRAKQAEELAWETSEKAKREAVAAEARVRELTKQLRSEKDSEVTALLERSRREAEELSARLRADAKAQLADAESRAKAVLSAELAKLAADKDAAVAAAQREADRRQAVAAEAARRELLEAEAKMERALREKEMEVARVRMEAERRAAEAATDAQSTLKRLEDELSRARQSHESTVQRLEAKAKADAEAAQQAKLVAQSAQSEIQRLQLEMTRSLQSAEMSATTREAEAKRSAEAAVRAAEDAARIAAEKGKDMARLAEQRASDEANKAAEARAAAEAARLEVDRVRALKDTELRAAVSRAKEESEAALRAELQRIKASEAAAQARAREFQAAAESAVEKARAEAEAADVKLRELRDALKRESQSAVQETVSRMLVEAEARAAQLQLDAKLRQQAAEERAQARLEAELARVAADKEAAVARAKQEADQRAFELDATLRREMNQLREESARLRREKDALAAAQAEAVQREQAAVQAAHASIKALEAETQKVRQERDWEVAQARAEAERQAAAARVAKEAATRAQSELERVAAEKSSVVAKLEAEAERRVSEAQRMLRAEVERAQDEALRLASEKDRLLADVETKLELERRAAAAAHEAAERARAALREGLEVDKRDLRAVMKERADAEAEAARQLERAREEVRAARLQAAQAADAERQAKFAAEGLTTSFEHRLAALTAQMQREKEEAVRISAMEAERRVASVKEQMDRELMARVQAEAEQVSQARTETAKVRAEMLKLVREKDDQIAQAAASAERSVAQARLEMESELHRTKADMARLVSEKEFASERLRVALEEEKRATAAAQSLVQQAQQDTKIMREQATHELSALEARAKQEAEHSAAMEVARAKAEVEAAKLAAARANDAATTAERAAKDAQRNAELRLKELELKLSAEKEEEVDRVRRELARQMEERESQLRKLQLQLQEQTKAVHEAKSEARALVQSALSGQQAEMESALVAARQSAQDEAERELARIKEQVRRAREEADEAHASAMAARQRLEEEKARLKEESANALSEARAAAAKQLAALETELVSMKDKAARASDSLKQERDEAVRLAAAEVDRIRSEAAAAAKAALDREESLRKTMTAEREEVLAAALASVEEQGRKAREAREAAAKAETDAAKLKAERDAAVASAAEKARLEAQAKQDALMARARADEDVEAMKQRAEEYIRESIAKAVAEADGKVAEAVRKSQLSAEAAAERARRAEEDAAEARRLAEAKASEASTQSLFGLLDTSGAAVDEVQAAKRAADQWGYQVLMLARQLRESAVTAPDVTHAKEVETQKRAARQSRNEKEVEELLATQAREVENAAASQASTEMTVRSRAEADKRDEMLRHKESLELSGMAPVDVAAFAATIGDEVAAAGEMAVIEHRRRQMVFDKAAERARLRVLRELKRQHAITTLREGYTLEDAVSAALSANMQAVDLSALDQGVKKRGIEVSAIKGDATLREQVLGVIHLVLRDRHTEEVQRLMARQQKDRAAELRAVLEDLFERRTDAKAALVESKEMDKASRSEINAALAELEKDFSEEQDRQQRALLNILEVMHSKQQLLTKQRQDNELLEAVSRFLGPYDAKSLELKSTISETTGLCKLQADVEARQAAEMQELERTRQEQESAIRLRNQAALEAMEREHAALVAQERERADMKLKQQRQKMMEEAKRAKEAKLKDAAGASAEDKARILKEFDESNRRLEVTLEAERERQFTVLQEKLDGRKNKTLLKKQFEMDADLRRARSEHAKKVADAAQSAMFEMMQGAVARARGVARAANKLKGTLAGIRARSSGGK